MLLVWSNQGSCSSYSYGLALHTRSLGSDNSLVKSTCYLSSCVPLSSRAIPDLPFQSISFPFPLVEHTYREYKSLWEGLKTDAPPALTEHMLSRTLRLVSFCLLQAARLLREGLTAITLNLKKNKAQIIV